MITATSASALVAYDEASRSLTVSGATTIFLLAQIRAAFAANEVDTVFMMGPGGSMTAGFEIGRLIRQEGARVIVPGGARCASACAFAAVASENLEIDGELLLHRPYIQAVPSDETVENIAAAYGSAYLMMAEYLGEMGFGIGLSRRLVEETGRCVLLVANAERDLDDMFISDRCESAR